jgi:uncharacterized SAM-binding protein YcdF (DUF218 family)
MKCAVGMCVGDEQTRGREAALVVCVLGCRSESATLVRRARAGGRAYFECRAGLVVACGGRAWKGGVEADAIGAILEEEGVPAEAIVRERCSLDTRDNARFAAALLRRRGLLRVALVTCAWHLPRATRLFRAAGLEVSGIGVPHAEATGLRRTYVRVREVLTSWKDARRTMRLA